MLAARLHLAADVVVEGRVKILCGPFLLGLQYTSDLLVLAFQPLVAPQEIDRTMFRGRHEPRARVGGDAGLRPLLERRYESILRKFLGNADIAHDPRESGNQPGRLDSPDRVDRGE